MGKEVSAIIPAHNEADLIGDTVKAVRNIPGVSQVVVVDDASSDATAEVAEQAGADLVVLLRKNLGKGGALNEGWSCASGDVLLLLDADLGSSAVEARRLIGPVLDDTADMTIAAFGRVPDEPGFDVSTSQGARSGGFGLVMRVAKLGIRLLTGKRVIAPLSGQRAVKREVIEKAGGFASKFGVEVALTVDALRLGYRIEEVPVSMVHRPSGRDVRGFMHRGRQLMDVIRALFAEAIK